MHEPFVGMFLRVFEEDRESFVRALLGLQLPRERMDLERIGQR